MRNIKMSPRLLAVLSLALAICCIVRIQQGQCANELEQDASDNQAPAKHGLFTDFKQFKAMFHKSYSSIREEMRRQKFFLARLAQSFISHVRHQNKMSSSFENINEMSDWTSTEFKRTLMNAEEYSKMLPEMIKGNEELKRELAKQMKNKLESLKTEASTASAAKPEPVKNNGGSWFANIGRGVLNALGGAIQMPVGIVGDATERLVQGAFMGALYNKGQYRPDLPDEVFIDHRTKRNCLNRARSQGLCGSCYIFSTIALYEWAYCAKEGSKIEFSEQYLLDCGSKQGLNGCDGGNEFAVSKFVENYGFELRDRYSYSQESRTCPYDGDKSQREEMGFVRMNKPFLVHVYPNRLDEELKSNPFIITIYPSKILQTYGGGIDTGEGCGKDLWDLHSVLLVGSGRQDGYEYWIIRNSYGATWGESGYYRLRKDSNCVANLGLGIRLKHVNKNSTDIDLSYDYSVNPSYDWHKLARRFNHQHPPILPNKQRML